MGDGSTIVSIADGAIISFWVLYDVRTRLLDSALLVSVIELELQVETTGETRAFLYSGTVLKTPLLRSFPKHSRTPIP